MAVHYSSHPAYRRTALTQVVVQRSRLIIYVKGKQSILTTEGLLQADLVIERMETLATRNYNLEARVEALEIANMKLLDGFKE
jgi:hypothetical protein